MLSLCNFLLSAMLYGVSVQGFQLYLACWGNANHMIGLLQGLKIQGARVVLGWENLSPPPLVEIG